jgi:CHAT domain-containing protein/Tfp pilus assembly protein PilF
MRAKLLLIAIVLAVVVQGTGFTQTEDAVIEYYTLGEQVNSYLETENYAAAIPLLKRLHELMPRELQPVEFLGILYASYIPEEKPEFANALFWLLEAEKMHSSYDLVYYELACVYSLKNDPEKAVTTMEKALALGWSNIEWISQDDSLVNFRNTSWWIGIADNYAQIQNQLTTFNEFNDTEEEINVDERINFYSSIIASLTELAPHIPALRCTPLSFLAYSFYNREDYTLAIQHNLELLGIREQVLGKDHPSYTTSLNNLGWLYYNKRDYAQAERYFLEELSIREKTLGKDHPDYASSLNSLSSYAAGRDSSGDTAKKLGIYADAELDYLGALNIREKVLGKDHPDYAVSLNKLGELYSAMGDYARAERNLLEALSIREKALGKDHPDYAVSLNNLGAFYYEMGDYIQAERYLLETLSIYELALDKDNLSYDVALLNNLGSLYNTMGIYDQAAQYFLEAIAVMEKTPGENHASKTATFINLGGLFRRMGDYATAEYFYLEALSIRNEVWGGLFNNLPDTANVEALRQVFSEFLDGTFYYAGLLSNLGSLYSDMGDYAQAERYYLEAMNIEERRLGKNHPDYISSLDSVYRIYLDIKEYNRAVPFKQEVYQLNTSQINRNFSFLSEQQRNFYWNTNSSSFESTYSLSWHHPVPESNILNYDNALFTKGLLLRTANAVRDAIYTSGDQTLITQFEELGRLRQQISALRQSGGNEEYIQNLEAQAEALDKSLTQSSAAFREFQADLAVGWQNVRDSLQPNEAAIEFVSFRIYDQGWTNTTQYAALVLRPGMDAPVWVPLCEGGTLAEIFEKLNGTRYPQEQTRIFYDEHGSALYDVIWRPLEEVLQGITAVYYSPSGLLHKISFNAIPVGNLRLMDVYDMNMVSSTREVVYRVSAAAQSLNSAVVYGGLQYDADAVSMLREAEVYTRSGSVQTRYLEFSDVDTSEYMQKTSGELTWNYLQFTDTESREIERLLNGNRVPVTLYNNVRGNKESFIALSGSRTEVIHLATHGFFNQDIEVNYDEMERMRQTGGRQRLYKNENPLRRSGLILSGANTWRQNPVEGASNGILLAEEVAGLNLLGAELVVLSACETALGEVDNSEGVFGLQRAFKLAGAQTLIMSLWKVDDEATSMLISSFYRNWLSGMGKQEAFKEAQRRLRSEPQYAPPFFWAAFVLMD